MPFLGISMTKMLVSIFFLLATKANKQPPVINNYLGRNFFKFTANSGNNLLENIVAPANKQASINACFCF